METEALAVFLCQFMFTVCSSCKWKFVVYPFDYEETTEVICLQKYITDLPFFVKMYTAQCIMWLLCCTVCTVLSIAHEF